MEATIGADPILDPAGATGALIYISEPRYS